MAHPAETLWTIDDFLAFDDGTDRRFELIRGHIVAMAPPAEAHGELVMRIGIALQAGLRPPCRVIMGAGIILPDRGDTYYQADLAITCAERRPGQVWVVDPVVVVEVLSPSTAATDLAQELPDYRLIPSLSDILVVASTERHLQHFWRTAEGWQVDDVRGPGVVRLRAEGVALDAGALYRDILEPEPKA